MTILDNLKKYFKENTIEQIRKDWDETKVYDDIDSPKVGELVKLFSMHFVTVPKGTFCDLYEKDCIGGFCSVNPNPEKCQYLKAQNAR
jgi:hypothetical protein